MRKKRYNRVQGVLFSDEEMQQMLHKRPPLSRASDTRIVLPSVSDYAITRDAVRANLECDGCTDPDVLDNFLGWWLQMPDLDSS